MDGGGFAAVLVTKTEQPEILVDMSGPVREEVNYLR